MATKTYRCGGCRSIIQSETSSLKCKTCNPYGTVNIGTLATTQVGTLRSDPGPSIMPLDRPHPSEIREKPEVVGVRGGSKIATADDVLDRHRTTQNTEPDRRAPQHQCSLSDPYCSWPHCSCARVGDTPPPATGQTPQRPVVGRATNEMEVTISSRFVRIQATVRCAEDLNALIDTLVTIRPLLPDFSEVE